MKVILRIPGVAAGLAAALSPVGRMLPGRRRANQRGATTLGARP